MTLNQRMRDISLMIMVLTQINEKIRGNRENHPSARIFFVGAVPFFSHDVLCLEGAIVCLFLIGMSFFAGCVAPSPPPAADRATPPTVFRSNDYVIRILKGGETPASLSEELFGSPQWAWLIEDANQGRPFEPGREVIIPSITLNKGGITANGFQTVPILCYHQFVKTDCQSPLCVPADIFESQMRYLKQNGYRVISMEALRDFLAYKKTLPQRAVIITIDDGYRSGYDIAYPILKKYNFTATYFIYTDFVAVGIAITWKQLKKLKQDGFEIGSHTVSHADLTKPHETEDEKAYWERIRHELVDSKKILDHHLNQDTILLAFPFGKYNTRVLKLCEEVGYKIGLSVHKGSNPFFADPLALKRNQMLKRDMDSFSKTLKVFESVLLK